MSTLLVVNDSLRLDLYPGGCSSLKDGVPHVSSCLCPFLMDVDSIGPWTPHPHLGFVASVLCDPGLVTHPL